MTPAAFKECLKALGLTQNAFCEIMKVTPVTVSRWSKGHIAVPDPVSGYLNLRMKHRKMLRTVAEVIVNRLVVELYRDEPELLREIAELLRERAYVGIQEEKEEEKEAFMCRTAWDVEFGKDKKGTEFFYSLEDLKREHPCYSECGIVKVRVSFSELILEGHQ